jgi:hypothetical protein
MWLRRFGHVLSVLPVGVDMVTPGQIERHVCLHYEAQQRRALAMRLGHERCDRFYAVPCCAETPGPDVTKYYR